MKGIMRHVCAEGLNLERLIRMAAVEGISLRNMRRRGKCFTALMDEADTVRLSALAEAGGWRFTVGTRRGAGRMLDALRRRWTLLLAGAAAFFVLQIAFGMVWQLEIIAPDMYAADAAVYLEMLGIRPVMRRSAVDLPCLRESLEWRYPRIAWAECAWRGTTLRVTLMEGVPKGESISTEGCGDVIALRDGIVESVITLAGTPVVAPGDVVRKGQVLISGAEATQEGTRPVMARGKVLARVWEQERVRIPAVEQVTAYTGFEQECRTIAGPWFDLWRTGEAGYDMADVSVRETPLGGLFFPFVFRVETRLEVTAELRPRDEDELRLEAGAAALAALRAKTGFRDDLVDKWVDYCMIEGEVLEAVATGERVIDIALQQRSGS